MEGLNRDLGKIIYMLKKSSNTHIEIRPGERRLNREEGGREAMAALRGKSGLAKGIATEETGGNLCAQRFCRKRGSRLALRLDEEMSSPRRLKGLEPSVEPGESCGWCFNRPHVEFRCQ